MLTQSGVGGAKILALVEFLLGKIYFYGSFHLSGPKFDIAVEMFCAVEFSAVAHL